MIADKSELIASFVIYLICMMAIGVYFYRRTRNMSDYILGNRKLGAWVTSLSAEASDMSGWMLMGLPGYAYAAGLSGGWIALGLAIGTYANWKFIAVRLRKYTQIADDSLTIPDFFQNRFHDTSNVLRVVSAIFILIFFIIYTSSGFVAGGKLFNSIFGIPYTYALLTGAFVVVFYTFIGGFLAVCWTDFIQGVMMFFAILIVPIIAACSLGGFTPTFTALYIMEPGFFNPFTKADGGALSFIELISLLAWGLGYFGQPHILVRFMAINSSGEIKRATRIAMTWVVISLTASVAVGMVGKVFLIETLAGGDVEKVFMIMANTAFSPFAAGLILSAVLAAIMSTASAQLLVAASAFSRDFYQAVFRKNADGKELIWVSRAAVVAVSCIALLLGLNPNNLILDMVSYAWAGFGAAFGPTLICALFWRGTTKNGALAGIITGGLTVLIWKQYVWLGLYEIVPGFIFSLLAIYIVSASGSRPDEETLAKFDSVKESKI